MRFCPLKGILLPSVSTLDTTEENIEYITLLFLLLVSLHAIMYSHEYRRIVIPQYSVRSIESTSFFPDDAIMKDDSCCSKPVDHLRAREGEGQRRNASKSKDERKRKRRERERYS
ncbi:hypothetical protein P5V15_013762 [Pogonomyrmex californicus]